MLKKKYISRTGIQYTFPIAVGDKLIWVTFNGNENSFETGNKEVQEAIESHAMFKSGKIMFAGQTGRENAPGDDNVLPVTFAEYAEVQTIQDAAAVLKGEPYKVPHQALRTPESVLKKALELGVSFPNLQ